MDLTVLRMTAGHADAAANLVRERLAALRRVAPELPPDAATAVFSERIARLADRGPGVVALDGGRLVGFLGSMPIRYGGRSSALSPEWGNGVAPSTAPDAARRIHEALYMEIARAWTREGIETHLVSLLANDAVAIETLSWLGFGHIVCDAVRSLDPVGTRGARYAVCRADASDAARVAELERGLRRHHDDSPIFLLPRQAGDSEAWAARLDDPSIAVWLAGDRLRPLGYLLHGPADGEGCDLVVDPRTSSITGAYVLPEARGRGLAAALLARGVEWASDQGYARLSVDFETANVSGRRFWLSHFHPVVLSMARTIRATCPVA